MDGHLIVSGDYTVIMLVVGTDCSCIKWRLMAMVKIILVNYIYLLKIPSKFCLLY